MTENNRFDDITERPTFGELLDWVEGRPSRNETIESLLGEQDQETVTAVSWIRGFLQFGVDNPMPQVPPAVRQRLQHSFERHHGRSSEVVRRRAERSFDSRTDALLMGVRGAGAGVGYRLAFAAETFGILMDVMPGTDNTVSVEGQVLSGDDESVVWEATVYYAGETMTDVLGKADGCFSISNVPIECSLMVLSNPMTEIEIVDPFGDAEV